MALCLIGLLVSRYCSRVTTVELYSMEWHGMEGYGMVWYGIVVVFKKNLNASKPSKLPPQVEECLKV